MSTFTSLLCLPKQLTELTRLIQDKPYIHMHIHTQDNHYSDSTNTCNLNLRHKYHECIYVYARKLSVSQHLRIYLNTRRLSMLASFKRNERTIRNWRAHSQRCRLFFRASKLWFRNRPNDFVQTCQCGFDHTYVDNQQRTSNCMLLIDLGAAKCVIIPYLNSKTYIK